MLTTEKIKEYRKIAKKIGIWDKDYSSLKKDIENVKADIVRRDYAFDILGGCLRQLVLMARLIVYGESETPLSDDDLKSLFTPLQSFDDLIYTPNMMGDEKMVGVDEVIPIMFKVANHNKNYTDFEKELRLAMILPSKVTRLGLSYGLAIGMCLRTYAGMKQYLPILLDYLKKILTYNEKAQDIIKTINKRFDGSEEAKQSFLFSALFATAVTECNINGDVSYDDMRGIVDRIDEIAVKNKDMYSFIHDDRRFKFFMHCIELYHEVDDE